MLQKKENFGILAQFESPKSLYEACTKMRDLGFQKWDAYSPFPVHGLDKAMGLKQSLLPWLVAAASLFCGVGGFLTWSWMNAVDYKYVIAGKPFFSWPAYFLPGFECAVLSAAIMCLIGMLALNKLPQWYHPLFSCPQFKKATDDGFFIFIESKDPLFHKEKSREFLINLGAIFTEIVED